MPESDGGGRHRVTGAGRAGRLRLVAVLGAAVVVLAVVAALLLTSGGRSTSADERRTSGGPSGRSPAAAAPGSTSPTGSASPSPTLQIPVDPTTPAPAAGVPVRLVVPSIGVDTGLQQLGTESDGTLESPSQWQVAGWYAKGTRPGDTGPAVIAGHVDSVNGPAVFFRLRDLAVGSAVVVYDNAGRVHKFTVSTIDEYPKKTFPSQAVYGPSPLPVLRLVTCTGDFDYSKRSYVDNLVVTAVLDGRTVPQ